MQFREIRDELITILNNAERRFLTAYQICQRIEESWPELWHSLVEEYPSVSPETPMGQGAGQQYSPASFVANALSYFNQNINNADIEIPGLRQELFECEGVTFNGIEPGFTGNVVGIWAIQA